MTELLLSGDAPELLETINLVINGVESAEDLEGIFTFVRQVALSAAPSCLDDLNTIDFIETNPTSSIVEIFIDSAHARSGALSVLKRVKIKPFFEKLRKALGKLDVTEEGGGTSTKKFNLAKFIAGLGTAFSAFDVLDQDGALADEAKEVLENIFDDRILLAGMVIGHRKTPAALKSMIKGDLPLRMRPVELLLAIAQIESSISEGKLDGEQYRLDILNPRVAARLDGRQLKWVVRGKYDNVFKDIIAKGSKRNLAGEKATAYIQVNNLNGEAFHLSNIARLLSNETPIIGVEGLVTIQFYQTSPSNNKSAKFGRPLKRRVDIVSGVIGSETWWEIKSLGYNRKNQGTGRTAKGIASGLTTLDLKTLSSKFKVRQQGREQILDEGTIKVKSGQFYSKEFFVDRVFAGSNLNEVPERMQWVLHSFRKANMNAFRTPGPIVDQAKFIQCGVNKPAGNCSTVYLKGKPNPLDAIRDRLVNSIRGPNEKAVKDTIFRTMPEFLASTQVTSYISGFKALAPRIIDSKNASSWIIQPLNASCEAQ